MKSVHWLLHAEIVKTKSDITQISSLRTFRLYSTSTSAHYFLLALVKYCWTLLVHPL